MVEQHSEGNGNGSRSKERAVLAIIPFEDAQVRKAELGKIFIDQSRIVQRRTGKRASVYEAETCDLVVEADLAQSTRVWTIH